jgi:transposase
MFFPMLADLCGTLSRPYTGRGRPRLPLSDIAYNSVAKIYSGLSARRFDGDVREAKEQGMTDSDPAFSTVLRRLRDPELTPYLEELVRLSAKPLAAVEERFAADATGFSTCNYARWYDHKWGKDQVKREWVKLHAMTGTLTNVVTDAVVTDSRHHDSPQFVPLLDRTALNFTMREVSADKAYSSKANLQAVANIGATPYVPFKEIPTGGVVDPNAPTPAADAPAWDRMYHLFALQRDTFLSHYHVRSNVETTFSMIKRKFGEALKSKSYEGQVNEVLCKVICHNLCCLISAVHELELPTPQFGLGPSLALVG